MTSPLFTRHKQSHDVTRVGSLGVIGAYRLKKRVGAGGMGVVYEAESERDHARVAVKVLMPHAADEPDGLSRFKREFRALARLRHPNIVRVFDAGIEEQTAFFAMEFVVGRDIRTYLAQFPSGRLKDAEIIRILRQLLSALSHIHQREIVHRDLKPDNIWITSDGRVKLMDFGVARILRPSDRDPHQGEIGLLGTFAYMAPEQVVQRHADGRSDLYAVGVILFELVTGRPPFPIEPPAAALHHHVHTIPPLVTELNPQTHARLADVCARLLRKDPKKRPQTAAEALAILAKRMANEGASREAPDNTTASLLPVGLIHKDPTWSKLNDLAEHTMQHRGSILVLEGGVGCGKSYLVDRWREELKQPVRVLCGRTTPRTTDSCHAFRDIFDSVAEILLASGGDAQKKILRSDSQAIAALSPRLASLCPDDGSVPDETTRKPTRLTKAAVGILGRLALTRPLVLVFEDLQLADAATLALIWDLTRTLLVRSTRRRSSPRAASVCPIGLVLTRRPVDEATADPLSEFLERLATRAQIAIVSVPPFSAKDIARVVQEATGVVHPAASLLRRLHQESRGNPALAFETLDRWVSSAALSLVGDNWFFEGQPIAAHDHTDSDDDDATPSLAHDA